MGVNKVVVIGGGASGLIAAISAAKKGADVTIVEKMDRVGKKILATGNGRCNMTNMNSYISYYYGAEPSFISSVLSLFNVDRTIQLFKELGILHKVESEGRVYPYSDQASSVLDVLRMEVERLNIDVVYGNSVCKIERKKDGFHVYLDSNSAITADRVIIACGGNAGPQYGSSGDGFKLAKSLGHTIVVPRPALVQILSDQWFFKRLKGIRVKGKVFLKYNNKILREERGEIQFTEDGLSGICIFDLSRDVHINKDKKQRHSIIIDLFPEDTADDLKEMLQMRVAYSPQKTIEEFFIGMINKRLIPVILKLSDIHNISECCEKLNDKALDKLVHTLKEWEVPVIGTRTWQHAQVTAGGVSAYEINPETLESLLVPRVYFAGEVIDVDGKCGGYNLQWAWSSGYVAGKNSAINI